MHPQSLLVWLATLTLSMPATASLPATCTSMQDVVPSHLDTFPTLFQNHICSQGCKPTMTDFKQFLSQGIITQIITAAIQQMGLQQFSSLADPIAEDATSKIEQKCMSGNTTGKNLCDDGKSLAALVDCLKTNMMPQILADVDQFSIFVTDDMCRKVKEFVQGPELWEITIPGAMDDYAATSLK
ncbi:uncharacterized protein BO97DRAFT_477054 [Aspergillus homomorphus CBS 101889]|uniref:Uncharacterized protein n=1 Tax=Aspergillus homomorphus (strain CBS 101889) TaxID=1450537 RepID=A0A395I2H8_ASPHC|nr:hypothetical protein BO97DRAFT_477054 [Aspergillus homomorphus CBS 101889]RAL13935.1 hypothetical protein BO97DRAFT_477054 [Aspergillus homomorphus CBS 101889]